MIEPVAVQHIMIAAIAGALIVLFGAMYALFFALGRLQQNSRFTLMAYAGYAGLVVAVGVLMHTLNMNGFWQLVAAVMVVGYFIAPRLIWHLCVGTHKVEEHSHPVPGR